MNPEVSRKSTSEVTHSSLAQSRGSKLGNSFINMLVKRNELVQDNDIIQHCSSSNEVKSDFTVVGVEVHF